MTDEPVQESSLDPSFDYLGLVELPEGLIIYNTIGLPRTSANKILYNVVRASLRDIQGTVIRPIQQRLQRGEQVSEQEEEILRRVNELITGVKSADDIKIYRRDRRAYLQSQGISPPQQTGNEVQLSRLEEEVERLERELANKGTMSRTQEDALRNNLQARMVERNDALRQAETYRSQAEDFRARLDEAKRVALEARTKERAATQKASEYEARLVTLEKAQAEKASKTEQALAERVANLSRDLSGKEQALDAATRYIAQVTEERVRLESRIKAYESQLGEANGDMLAKVDTVVTKLQNSEHPQYTTLIDKIRKGRTEDAKKLIEEQFQGYDVSREQRTVNLYAEATSIERKDPKKAREMFTIVLGTDNKNHAALLGAARCSMRLTEYKEAKGYASDAKTLDVNSAESYFLLAEAVYKIDGASQARFIKHNLKKAEGLDKNLRKRADQIRRGLE
ncbi:hypothetical protein J4216_03220 [Candidatus Woesearchaeota archaeon]|nr:hypothetical protein [Candidatus Woesearchaeota archaeon]